MNKFLLLFVLSVAVIGCGKSEPVKTADTTAPAKANTDDAKMCITEFLTQCGMKDVAITEVKETSVPVAAKTATDSWGFSFTAEYKNVFGETQQSQNWVAVVANDSGKLHVRTCWNDKQQMVGGHQGPIETPKAELLPVSVTDNSADVKAPETVIIPVVYPNK